MRKLDDETLGAYVDDQLEAGERERVEEVVSEDVETRQRLADIRRVSVLTAAAFALDTRDDTRPESFVPTLGESRRQRSSGPWLGRAAWLSVGLPVGLAVALFLGFGLGYLLRPELGTRFDWPARAYDFHAYYQRADTGRGRALLDVSGDDPREVEAWAQRHLPVAVAVPDLASLGLRLQGGRLHFSEGGPVVQLIYSRPDGRLLSVVLSDQPARSEIRTPGGEAQAVVWTADDLTVALFGPFDHPELREISALVSAALP